MKRIGTTTVIALSIVTLGIYSFIWLGLRGKELAQNYKINMPSIGWIIASAVVIYLGTFVGSAAIMAFILGAPITVRTTVIAMVAPLVLGYTLALPFIIPFAKNLVSITGGKLPLWWTALFYLPLFTFVIGVYQFFINRIEATPPKHDTTAGPTPRFIFISFAAAIVLYALYILNYKDFPSDLETARSQTPSLSSMIEQATTLSKKAETLKQQHTDCLANLEKKYPGELTKENEPGYQAGYEKCENIRRERDKTTEQLNNLGR